MAYFACGKAALTGTDKSTRASIAKGLVSPTFINAATGKETLRGVVQLDVVSGRDMEYVTARNLSDRMKSATIDTARKYVATPPTAYKAGLHDSPPGTIKTTTTLGLSKKAIITGLLIVGGIGYMVMR